MTASPDFNLRSDEVVVWHARLDPDQGSAKACRDTLSDDERERASRYLFERDRRRFEIARGVLRILLGRCLDLPAAAIRFRYTSFGKPSIVPDQNPGEVTFNLSHSGENVILAFSRGRELGVDIEEIRDEPEADALARMSFSAREQAEFHPLPPHLKARAFFLCWTRKEAFVKATGHGFSLPLASFDVSLAPGEPAVLRGAREGLDLHSWHLVNLDVGFGCAAALVGSAPPFTVRQELILTDSIAPFLGRMPG